MSMKWKENIIFKVQAAQLSYGTIKAKNLNWNYKKLKKETEKTSQNCVMLQLKVPLGIRSNTTLRVGEIIPNLDLLTRTPTKQGNVHSLVALLVHLRQYNAQKSYVYITL